MEYDKEGSALRIRGKNVLENEYVKVCNHPTLLLLPLHYFNIAVKDMFMPLQIGAFHTLEIEPHRPFVLRKVCLLDQIIALSCDLIWQNSSVCLCSVYIIGLIFYILCLFNRNDISNVNGVDVYIVWLK